nr:hypothetical protein CFP56_70094 [Quercus suber]
MRHACALLARMTFVKSCQLCLCGYLRPFTSVNETSSPGDAYMSGCDPVSSTVRRYDGRVEKRAELVYLGAMERKPWRMVPAEQGRVNVDYRRAGVVIHDHVIIRRPPTEGTLLLFPSRPDQARSALSSFVCSCALLLLLLALSLSPHTYSIFESSSLPRRLRSPRPIPTYTYDSSRDHTHRFESYLPPLSVENIVLGPTGRIHHNRRACHDQMPVAVAC